MDTGATVAAASSSIGVVLPRVTKFLGTAYIPADVAVAESSLLVLVVVAAILKPVSNRLFSSQRRKVRLA